MKVLLGVVAALSLSACVSSTSSPQSTAVSKSDPRYVSLYQMPVTEFYANVRLAGEIGASCSGLQRDSRVDFELNEQRNKAGRGSFSALRLRSEIDTKSAALRSDFLRQHGSLCTGASREFAAGTSALSYLLKTG